MILQIEFSNIKKKTMDGCSQSVCGDFNQIRQDNIKFLR